MLHTDYLFRLNSVICSPVIQTPFLPLFKPLGALWFKITKAKPYICWKTEHFNEYISFRSIKKGALNRTTSSDKQDKR